MGRKQQQASTCQAKRRFFERESRRKDRKCDASIFDVTQLFQIYCNCHDTVTTFTSMLKDQIWETKCFLTINLQLVFFVAQNS